MTKSKWYAIAAVLLLAIVFALIYSRSGSTAQYLTSKVQRGEIKDVVEATGTVNAVVNVQVGSQVSGTIAKLNVDFNSTVKRGDVVAVIDPALFQGALQQAKADLESAQANVVVMQANVDKAHATEVQAKADYERAIALVKQKLQSQQALDLAKAAYDSAMASTASALAAVTQAKAQVRQKEAAVGVAQTNLDYADIRSPIDGVVVNRSVDVGQTVAASFQAPTIFTIAQDLKKMLLYAKTDESDVGRIKVGQDVTFKVDAFPKETFHGRVDQLRMNATTVQNVVTYDTVISFDNPDQKLFPGMTAYVTIPVATVEDVVKIPNTALRFEPSLSAEELQATYARFGIDPKAVATRSPQSTATDATSREPRRETGVVWKLHNDGNLEPVVVSLGITDHAYTELAGPIKGEIKIGDDVVTAAVTPGKATQTRAR
jgi:HlyD family secretion protein